MRISNHSSKFAEIITEKKETVLINPEEHSRYNVKGRDVMEYPSDKHQSRWRIKEKLETLSYAAVSASHLPLSQTACVKKRNTSTF